MLRWTIGRGKVRNSLVVLGCLLCLLLAGCSPSTLGDSQRDKAHDPLVVAGIPSDEFPTGEQLTAEFTRRTGIAVRLIPGAESPLARLKQDRKLLQQKARTPDVYALDVTWPAVLAPDLVDLRSSFRSDLAPFVPSFIKNNIVNHRLIAIPMLADIGLLYYRTDLLQKYGYRHPPRTWTELAAMARVIQAGERAAGHRDFWGYVWQGTADESLTCNALEWQTSFGGGDIIEANHTISVNNPRTIQALQMARSWIGTISPPGVVAYEEEDARNLWTAGDAAFMRNWPYAYSMSEAPDSAVRGHFDVTELPSGGSRHAGVLGGWALGISKYAEHPREAALFVRFMTSARMQTERLEIASQLPTMSHLYADPSLLPTHPLLARAGHALLATGVARPSLAAAGRYGLVSAAYFQAVHSVLTGDRDAAAAMSQLQSQLVRITGYPPGSPLPDARSSP